MRVCIYGASSARLDGVYCTEATKLGELLAEKGHSLVFGGGTEGLMGACARGVHARGGKITGIAPWFFNQPGILFEDCTEMIYTTTMRERKQKMEEMSDACVVLPGGIGTYEEFFEMLTLKQLGKSERAIVLLNTRDYFAPMQALLEHTARTNFMSEGCMTLYSAVDTPEDVIEALETYVPRTGDLDRLANYNK